MENDMINVMFHERSNMAILSIKQIKPAYRRNIAVDVGKKLLQLAALLKKEQIVGLQIKRGEDGKNQACIFSSKDAEVNAEDFGWMFLDCADIGPFCEVSSVIRHGATDKIYELCQTSDISGKQLEGCENETSNSSCFVSWNYFRQLFNEIEKADVAVQFSAGVSQKGIPAGAITFSMAGEMSLRLRTLISLAFPNTKVRRVTETVENPAETGITMNLLLESVKNALEVLMDERYDEEIAKKTQDNTTGRSLEINCNSESRTEETGFPSIDDLDLSVRSYNCLRRAGISTIEELRRLSDEDYYHIRNLSRKCIEEIKQKLYEFETLTEDPSMNVCNYANMLNELIGLNEVKKQVGKIAAFVTMRQDMRKLGMPLLSTSLNMEFVGNPGTAKTTVARILAGIFHETGLLGSEELVEVGRAELVSEYVGQTAGKVKAVFQRAKGKLLFIDEAYSLVEDRDGSFGDEAINTIVQEMENNRNDTVVIFAGYPDKMKEFFSGNPGLRSRVPFCIHFPDYTVEEMVQIVELEATKRGFSLGENAREAASDICKKALRYPDAGNGRFCRNLVENAILEYAFRTYGPDSEENVEKNFMLQEKDFVLPENMQELKNCVPIGFRVA